MNTKNANQELGFDVFSESNYNLHWSFSNFNRMLMVAGQIAQLPFNSSILELGAGSSDLENIVKNNFKRNDISFDKVDGDSQYESVDGITVLDITSDEFDKRYGIFRYDAIVFMEVIEHLNYDDAELMLGKIYRLLKPECMLFLTTPTPPRDALWEDRVWPQDHEKEFTFHKIYDIINLGFKVQKSIGWSLEEREYNQLLEAKPQLAMIYTKLRGAYPESYIRALIASLAPVEWNRQVLLICKKRREPNGC